MKSINYSFKFINYFPIKNGIPLFLFNPAFMHKTIVTTINLK